MASRFVVVGGVFDADLLKLLCMVFWCSGSHGVE